MQDVLFIGPSQICLRGQQPLSCCSAHKPHSSVHKALPEALIRTSAKYIDHWGPTQSTHHILSVRRIQAPFLVPTHRNRDMLTQCALHVPLVGLTCTCMVLSRVSRVSMSLGGEYLVCPLAPKANVRQHTLAHAPHMQSWFASRATGLTN